MKKLLMLCAIAFLTVSAIAQEKPAARPPAKKQQAQSALPVFKPSPEMRKMTKTFVGKWTAVVKTEAMAGMPANESRGYATFRSGPGGLSLIEEFHTNSGAMGNFIGHGVTYWDDQAKNYTGMWCDSMTPTGCLPGGTSKWEGDNIVGFMDSPDETGKMTKYRMTYSNIKPDAVTFTMEQPDGSGGYKKVMSILYTRAVTAPATPAAKKE